MTLSTHIDQEGVRIEPFLSSARARNGTAPSSTASSPPSAPPTSAWATSKAQLAANHVGAVALRRHDRPPRPPHRPPPTAATLLDYAPGLHVPRRCHHPPRRIPLRRRHGRTAGAAAPSPIPRHPPRPAGDRAPGRPPRHADQGPGCINCPDAVTRSAVYYCFACLLATRGVPLNGGAFRDIEVLPRPGSVLHARYPAAVVAGNTETSQRVVDVVLGVLAQALPDPIPAASCGTIPSVALGDAGLLLDLLRNHRRRHRCRPACPAPRPSNAT